MGIKIWLDDVRPCPYIGWIVAKTVSAAKELFLNNEVDDASFDNDLGGSCEKDCWTEIDDEHGNSIIRPVCNGVSCPCSCHEEGFKLVDWLEETGKWPKKKPTVHSSNSRRAIYMREVINKYYGVNDVKEIFGKG